jgi:hypothetical protein
MAPTMQPTFTRPKSPTKSRSFQRNTPDPTLNPDAGDAAAGSGSSSVASGSGNNGAKAAIGVLLPISIIIILVVGYLILCNERRVAGLDSQVDLNEVGTYTI